MIDLCERCHEPLDESDDRTWGYCRDCSESMCEECDGAGYPGGEQSNGVVCGACGGTGDRVAADAAGVLAPSRDESKLDEQFTRLQELKRTKAAGVLPDINQGKDGG